MVISSFRDLIDKGWTFLNLLIAVPIEIIVKVKPNRIICWSFGQHKYACNPKAFTEYLLENHPGEYEIIWAFEKGIDTSTVDPHVKVVFKNTIAYAIALGSSRFVFSNSRCCIYADYFIKKNKQKYIMTWHGSLGTKPCEKDAEKVLPTKYIKYAKRDSKICDLFLSGNSFLTDLYKRAFWYDGEILEKCFPRNDIYFNSDKIEKTKQRVYRFFNIPTENATILYAPTFRSDMNIDVYKIQWKKIIEAFESRFNRRASLIIKLHPNCIGVYKKGDLFSDVDFIDAIDYPDISDLICASNYMISDYSSAIFDMAYMYRPCFVYAPDMETYDRGYYFQIKDLPFPYAITQVELCQIIKNYDEEQYHSRLSAFFSSIGMKEDGLGAKRLYDWIKGH